ncbi:hypothetical protein PTKIN_Ptkin14bG0157700 [Pterospermum kingtungense]
MAQEDQTQRCSNSNTSSGGGNIGNSSSGRSSKKQRPKKVPQRGLGVAQLERIRIEEQQKKDAALAVAAPILPSPSSVISPSVTHHKSPYLSLPIPSFQYPSNQSSSIPFPADISPPNSTFRPPLSVQNIDNIVSSTANTAPLTCGSAVWPPGAAILPGNGSVSNNNNNNGNKFWSSCEYKVEKECSGLDPGLAFRANLSLPYESEPIWPLPSLMQRAQFFQQPSSSMVNLSSRTSSTSVLDFQMEPPSNQSYYGNCSPFLPDDEKMLGMKRPYPFSLDNAPGPPIDSKYHPIVHSINGQVESASTTGKGISTFNFKADTPNFREGPSCSTLNMESRSKKINKQNGAFDGDFLTLAPPTTMSMCSSSKPNKHPTYCELPDLDSLPYQPSFEDPIIRQGASGLNQSYRPYYSFFPPAMVQIDRASAITMAKCKGGEVGGHVDLNLKL